MIRRPPRSTRTDTLFPYTTLFRSQPQLTAYFGLPAPTATRRRRFARPDPLDRNPLSVATPEIHLHRGDLPAGLRFGGAVAIARETLGLQLDHARPSLRQPSAGAGVCHLCPFTQRTYHAPHPTPP